MFTANLFYSNDQSEINFNAGDNLAQALIRAGVATSDVNWEASTVFVDSTLVQNPRTFTLNEANKTIVVGKLRTHG